MNILFIGGEDSDFTSIGGVGVDTTTTHFRSAYARCALKVAAGAVGDCWSANFSAAASSFWATARVFMTLDGNVAGNFASRIMAFTDNGTVRLALAAVVTSFSSTNQWAYKLVKISAAGVVTTLATAVTNLSTNIVQKIDMFVNYGTSGEVQVHLDGTKIIEYQGNVVTDTATTLSSIQLGSPAADGAAGATYWSECVVADSDTRGLAVATLAVSAAGNTQSWTGANTDINEVTLDDATTISSTTNDAVSEWTVTAPSALTSTTGIVGVAVTARAAKGATGPQNLQAVVRTGGVDYPSADLAGLSTTLGHVQNVWATNPNTGLAWTGSDLLAAGFNIGLEAKA